MALDWLALLLRMTLGASCAIMVVLLLRAWLRRAAGASLAYKSWLLVPLMMAAAALPQLKTAPALAVILPATATPNVVAGAVAASTAWTGSLLLAWACGALATLALFVHAQRRFVRSLGPLTASRTGANAVMLAPGASGPLLLGLWDLAIVVPADFSERYTAAEQALIIAHEKAHAARRDHVSNAVLALLQCVFWFNPLVHVAASRCRFDQELACDAAVMARHAGQRQAYASAMLKTQSKDAPALAGCHWQSHHPLKERLMQLKQDPPRAKRRLAGRAIVAVLACAGVLATVAVRADTPAAKPSYKVALQFTGAAGDSAPQLLVRDGEEATLSWKQGTTDWVGVMSVTGAPGGAAFVKMKISEQGAVVANPGLLVKLGQTAAVSVGEEGSASAARISLTVTRPVAK